MFLRSPPLTETILSGLRFRLRFFTVMVLTQRLLVRRIVTRPETVHVIHLTSRRVANDAGGQHVLTRVLVPL